MSVDAAVTATSVIIFGGMQLALCHGQDRPRSAYILLILGLLPLTWGVPSTAMAYGFAAALVTFSAPRAAIAIVACGSGFALAFRGGFTEVSLPMVMLELVIAAVILTVITHLAVLGNKLRLAQELLARRNVDIERERISRHLHDVLGRTLVAASLRNQTTLRTLGERNQAVGTELQQLQETLAGGQQRVRAVTSGPAISSWRDEISAARMLCQRIGIVLSIEVVDDPPAEHRALVALAIRESVTNVLKHSRATRIDLTVGTDGNGTTIKVENDGVLPVDPGAVAQSRLKDAIEQASGALTMGVTDEQRYRVDITLPAAQPAQGESLRLP